MMKTARGRILLVTASLMVGGTERQLVLLAEHLVSRGWQVQVFALSKTGALLERLDDLGVKVIDGGLDLSKTFSIRKFVHLARCELQLMREIRKWKPDVVHSFLPLPNFMGAVAGRIAGAPLVVTSKRGLGTHQDRHPQLRWLDWIANYLSHVVTANSQAIALDTQRRDNYAAERVLVIQNGLDFSPFECGDARREEARQLVGVEPNERAIVCVANLLPYKGHCELFSAFAILAKKFPAVKLVLIGEDRGIALSLETQARENGMADRIVFMGRRSDVPFLLAGMDIGVVPSHEEGSSNALLEKLAAGLPVVATAVGGNVEALEGMPDCTLVRAKDPEDLARGLARIMSNIEEASVRREMRRALVQARYSVASMGNAYEQLYQRRLIENAEKR